MLKRRSFREETPMITPYGLPKMATDREMDLEQQLADGDAALQTIQDNHDELAALLARLTRTHRHHP